MQEFEQSLALEWKLIFSSLVATDVFQICWHFEGTTFTASSFRIWNSSTEIPSPSLTLLIVMLPKAHLILHSRLSGSRIMITHSWLSVSWTHFCISLCVFLPPLLNIFCFVHVISVLYYAHLRIKYFLDEISSLSHPFIFLYFFALITFTCFTIQ